MIPHKNLRTTYDISGILHPSARFNMSYESEPTVNAISFPIMFPTFEARNPHSLFRQDESIFIVRGISKQNTMFHHVLSALPTDVVSQVTHAIDKPPEDELYTTLKCAVILRLRCDAMGMLLFIGKPLLLMNASTSWSEAQPF